MPRACRSDRERPAAGAPGFTIVELLVALTLAVLVMTIAAQLVFSLRRAAVQMQLRAETRSSARRALDYLAFHVRGATDLNREQENPAAILVWYQRGGNPVQATYNNVTAPNLADPGTDILTVAIAANPVRVRCLEWPGFQHAANARWGFSMACPDGDANLQLFKDLTGYDPDSGTSRPLIVVDSTGAFGFYQITNYLDSWNANQGCNQTPPELHVVANPGNSDMLNPPGGQPTLQAPIFMHLGVHYMTFRVREGRLEQKSGIFDPATDNPGTAFSPIVDGVEDLQIAWVFEDGTVWNTPLQTLQTATYPGAVPAQNSALDYDVVNVRGVRLSVTTRSAASQPYVEAPDGRRPAVEDRDAGPRDRFYHETATTLAMIRNRNLQQ